MTDTEIVDAIRAILAPVDLHRNRERREAMEAIRLLLDIPEGIVPTADDLGEKDASNGSGGTLGDGLEDKGRAELNAIAKDAGLDPKGKQADLIDRIREHRAANPVVVEESTEESAGAPEVDPTPEDAPEAPADDQTEPEDQDDATERPGPRVAEDDPAPTPED